MIGTQQTKTEEASIAAQSRLSKVFLNPPKADVRSNKVRKANPAEQAASRGFAVMLVSIILVTGSSLL